jgi:L-threonylcarbamoyladenylate synthase
VQPRILRVDPNEPAAEPIREAAALLRAGELVAFPTETVYGLGARGLDPAAVRRIFAAKGRPATHPLILHVTGEQQARSLAERWSDAASSLARAFWPGPLTLVVPRARVVPDEVTGGGDTVAIRAPSHPVARALIAEIGEPLAAPSANRYQTLSPTTAAHVVKSLGGAVSLVLDAGGCPGGIESTVLDLSGARPRVLRPGGVSIAAVRAILPETESAAGAVPEDVVRPSPGMDARHYAPRAPLTVCRDRGEAIARALEEARTGTRVGLVLRGGDGLSHDAVLCRVLPDSAEGYARALFAVLHELDDVGVSAIFAEPVPGEDAWQGVADRLRRASTPPPGG